MKHLAFTAVSFLCLSSGYQAKAQLYKHPPTQLGVKAGGTAFIFTNNSNSDLRLGYGFHGGLFASVWVGPNVWLQPEVLFSMKGTRGSDDIYVPIKSLRINYLDVPLALRFKSRNYFAEVGPQVGFRLSAQADFNGTEVDVKENVRATDYGYLLGVGYQPLLGGLGGGIRYNGGFTKAFDTPPSVFPFTGRERNGAIQAYLTYSRNKNKVKKKE